MAMEWLVVYGDSYQRDRNGYRATVYNSKFHPEINSWIPCIRVNDGTFLGMAKVYEFHVMDESTIVFFTLDTKMFSGKDAAAISRLYRIISGNAGNGASKRSSYSDSSGFKGSSSMDPAMAMSMGYGRSPEEIARKAGRRERDDDSISIEEIMRMQGYGDEDD